MQIEMADKMDELITPVELHRIAPKVTPMLDVKTNTPPYVDKT
jgi:hypothetical protein